MTTPNQASVLDTSSWQLEFARLIAFTTVSAMDVDQRWWHELAAGESTDFVPTRQPAYRDDRGSINGKLLALTVDPRRIIWELRSPRMVDESGRFPTLGVFADEFDEFVALLSPWLGTSCPPIVRMGLNAKLLQAAENAAGAYEQLKQYLPGVSLLDSDPDELNDFVLQINRRKPSADTIPGLPVNRVCTWAKLTAMTRAEHGSLQWASVYSSLELDINTAPEKTGILPASNLSALLEEFSRLGKEIVEFGGRP